MVDHGADRTLNIFASKGYRGIRCAVPADLPLPGFLLSGTWQFESQSRRREHSLLQFVTPSALHVTDVTGCYFFTDFGADRDGASD
ncbi:MAG TPA: hypothetical protein VH414_14000 [Lichenihabitans sp.]|jgi:hypothetical protein|nr:hypothetical protein [Lichenihabitans sp.]